MPIAPRRNSHNRTEQNDLPACASSARRRRTRTESALGVTWPPPGAVTLRDQTSAWSTPPEPLWPAFSSADDEVLSVHKGSFLARGRCFALACPAGWPHAGDLDSMDERGYCRMAGRLKEMIVRGGESTCQASAHACPAGRRRPGLASCWRAVTAMGPEGRIRVMLVTWEDRGWVMTQVTEHLRARGVPFEPIAHQQAFTSVAEARALGIDASEVLKTVAMRVGGGYALMAVPATCHLAMHLVQAAVGDRHARLATEQELLRDFPGIELGALPPLGSLLGAPLYVDQEVLQHETVVFAAGSQTESVQVKTADLLQHEQVTTVPLIRHADENHKDWPR